jgi:hypothetical protein
MKKNHQPSVYIALEDCNFDWSISDLNKFKRMWNAGASIFEIAKTLRRSKIEVAILIIDQGKKGKIEHRKGGLFGNDFKGNGGRT